MCVCVCENVTVPFQLQLQFFPGGPINCCWCSPFYLKMSLLASGCVQGTFHLLVPYTAVGPAAGTSFFLHKHRIIVLTFEMSF